MLGADRISQAPFLCLPSTHSKLIFDFVELDSVLFIDNEFNQIQDYPADGVNTYQIIAIGNYEYSVRLLKK